MTTNAAEEKKLWIAETAERLGVKPETIRTWVRLRLIPFHKMGKRVIFLSADVDRFFNSRRVPSRDELPSGRR